MESIEISGKCRLPSRKLDNASLDVIIFTMTKISKETLKHLANLGKIHLREDSEEKLLVDLEKILAYFEELQGVNTENIEPLSGGTIEKNVLRSDSLKAAELPIAEKEKLLRAFPEKSGGFLKVPPVFE